MPTMRSRVDCGFGLTMLSFWPMIRLRSVDLPALGFPTTVTIPARGMVEGSYRSDEEVAVSRRETAVTNGRRVRNIAFGYGRRRRRTAGWAARGGALGSRPSG